MKLFTTLVLVTVGQMVSVAVKPLRLLASLDFSQKLYQQIAVNKTNVVFSPFSIHNALTMTSLGARGETLTEMRDTLGISILGDRRPALYRAILQVLNTDEEVQTLIGSVVYVQPNCTIAWRYFDDAWQYHSARTGHFNRNKGGPEQLMNEIISDKTENKIEHVLTQGRITGDTVMLLINGVFFKATWERPFNKGFTELKDFILPCGNVMKVEMMHDTREVNIKRDNLNGVDIARLPFKGNEISLYIVLPLKLDGIADTEKLLSRPGMSYELISGLTPARVNLAIPRFKTESSIKLNDALREMGIVKAFLPSANFSGVSKECNLFIEEAIHKTVIEVQETGTSASSSTKGVLAESTTLTTKTFVADHPFVYFIMDKAYGQVILQGKFSG